MKFKEMARLWSSRREVPIPCVTKEQIWQRIRPAFKNSPPAVRTESQEMYAQIPITLLPKKFKAGLVIDVAMLKGQVVSDLVVDAQGRVVGCLKDGEYQEPPEISVNFIYAVRVRSGFWGRLGVSRWRSICE